MKLSFRDQVILIVVIILASMLAGFFLLIKPQMDSLKANEAALAAKVQEKADIEAKIQSVSDLREKVTLVYEENLKLQEFFLPEMYTYEVDQFLYPYLKENNIKIEGLDLSAPETVNLPNYVYDIEELEYALREYTDTNAAPVPEGQPVGSMNNNEQGEELISTEATFTYHGKMDDVRKFMDAIEKEKRAFMITSIDIKPDEASFEPNAVTGDITIKFYSMARVVKPIF